MRDWNLSLGDPLSLGLAADFRLGNVDYTDDHIWELELGLAEPPALSLYTTYGLRARAMRFFPRFREGGLTQLNPLEFSAPPRLRRFYPNFLALGFSPLSGIEVEAEIWIPDSHTAAMRLSFINHSTSLRQIHLDLCGLLIPLDGRPFAALGIQGVTILSGQTGNLMPVLFLTGGPQPGPGPYPCLTVDLDLGPGARRQLTCVEAACATLEESFALARRTAARTWDAERARIENLNAAQTVHIQTGDLEWDAALAFSQKEALRLFFPPNDALPHPTFVLARNPDHGYSPRQDGSDYPPYWSGQPVLETFYLSGLLPGAPELSTGLLMNFLSTQGEGGSIDCRPGLAGQRGRFLAAPLLASLAWRLHSYLGDDALLVSLYPRLLAFWRTWFHPDHDRDGDGFPEWDHPIQTGYEENPAFSTWYSWSQGAAIDTVESPALAALLAAEAKSLERMALHLQQVDELAELQERYQKLKTEVDACWHARTAMFRNRDRDTHLSQPGKVIAKLRGPGEVRPKLTFEQPVRLLVQIQAKGPGVSRPEVEIREYVTRSSDGDEIIPRQAFGWHAAGLTATSQRVFQRIGCIRVSGTGAKDRVSISVVNLNGEDHTLFLPLWARLPDVQRAQTWIGRSLLDAGRFDRPFGVPACPFEPKPDAGAACLGVHLPWNQFIVEGLLAWGFREEAARLYAHCLSAAIQNLKQTQGFAAVYHAETGAALGERNVLSGLPSTGLFLEVLGVRFLSGGRVRLEGRNPFPWPVTAVYRGVMVRRDAEETLVTFRDGRTAFVRQKEACIVAP